MSTCSKCRYVFPAEVRQEGQRQHCRRFPPDAQALMVPRQASPLQPNSIIPVEEHRSIFPAVMPEWSCGEFAPRLDLTS